MLPHTSSQNFGSTKEFSERNWTDCYTNLLREFFSQLGHDWSKKLVFNEFVTLKHVRNNIPNHVIPLSIVLTNIYGWRGSGVSTLCNTALYISVCVSHLCLIIEKGLVMPYYFILVVQCGSKNSPSLVLTNLYL